MLTASTHQGHIHVLVRMGLPVVVQLVQVIREPVDSNKIHYVYYARKEFHFNPTPSDKASSSPFS